MNNIVIPILVLICVGLGVFLYLNKVKNDKPIEVEPMEIDGRWVVVEAERDYNPTKMLNEAVFEFDQSSGSITTDWLGSLASSPMEIEQGEITQEIPEINYSISEYRDSVLVLASRYRGSVFQMKLKRAEDE